MVNPFLQTNLQHQFRKVSCSYKMLQLTFPTYCEKFRSTTRIITCNHLQFWNVFLICMVWTVRHPFLIYLVMTPSRSTYPFPFLRIWKFSKTLIKTFRLYMKLKKVMLIVNVHHLPINSKNNNNKNLGGSQEIEITPNKSWHIHREVQE